MIHQTKRHSPACLDQLEPRVLLSHTNGLDHTVFYPEGFVHDNISEAVIISNPTASDSPYELWARYEVGQRDQLLASGVLEAGRREDITLATEGGAIRLVRSNTPFALELKSNHSLVATLRHDDFSGSTAEDFTSSSSSDWAFPTLLKDSSSRDFVVLYNPGETTVVVTLRGFDDSGQRFDLSHSVGSKRRSGWNITNSSSIPLGNFAGLLTSTGPIVAALSHYSLDSSSGEAFSSLGTQNAGDTAGAILSLEFEDRLVGSSFSSSSSDTIITVFNPGQTTAQVQLHVLSRDTSSSSSPGQTTILSVDSLSRIQISLRSLGFSSAEHLSLVYESDAPVSVNARIERSSAVFGVASQPLAATEWLFANAGIDRVDSNGRLRTEDVFIFNPTASSISVTVQFVFTNGQTFTQTKSLDPLQIENVDARIFLIPGSLRDLSFTVSVQASATVVAALEHWSAPSSVGGFANPGSPAGTIVKLADILAI